MEEFAIIVFMQKSIESLPGQRYWYHGYPNRPSEELERRGINCIALIHQIYKDLGVILPSGMWAKEILEDEDFAFRTLGEEESYRFGDIFVFGPAKSNPYRLHLALFTGEFEETEPILFHITSKNGETPTNWRLSQFQSFWEYGRIYGIKRLADPLFKISILPVLYYNGTNGRPGHG